MASILVGTYSVRLRRVGEPGRFLPFGAIGDPPLFRSLTTALQGLRSAPWKNATARQVLRMRSVRLDGVSDVWGRLEQGEYGLGADLIDSETFSQRYARMPADAELIPLYFRIHLPPHSDFGLLLLQRFGVHGALGNVRAWLDATMKTRHPEFALDLGAVVPERVSKQVLEGGLKQVTVVMHSIPRDIADSVDLGSKQTLGRVELRINARRDSTLASAWIPRIRTNHNRIREYFGSNADNVRVKLNHNGRTRTYDVLREDALTPNVDVTEEVSVDSDGHPRLTSIDEVCIAIRDEILTERSGG